MDARIFSAMYPTGIIWSDTWIKVNGDYKKLAFLSYGTLGLEIEPDCSENLRDYIIEDAARIQKRQGEYIEYTASGQKILLGHAKLPEENIYSVIVSFYYNVPSMEHTKTVEIEAGDSIEAEEKVRKMFPNIISLAVMKG